MLPDPMTIPDDLLLIANEAVAAHMVFASAAAAFVDAGNAVNAARDARGQKLADLRNAMQVADLSTSAFQHNGYVFRDDVASGGTLEVSAAPPLLEDMGGEP